MLAAVGTGGVVGGEDGRTLSPPRQPDEEGGKSARAICNGGEDDGGSSGSQGGYSNSDVDGEEGDESTQIDANSGEWSDTASYVSDSDGDSHCSGRSSGRDGVAVGRDRSGGGDGGGGAGMGGGRSDESAGIGTGRTGARRADGSGRAGWRAELGVNSVVVSAASPTSAGGAGPSSSRQKNTGSSPMLRGVRSRGRGCAGAMPLDDNELATSLSSGGGIDDDDEDDEDDDGDDADDDDDDDGDTDDPLEPIPGEVKLVPSMFPDRPPTVFFEYPKELGMARFDNVCYSEPLGSRRLLFKCHWERNSVKNAFYRAGFSRTKSTLSWTASWGKHPTREGFRNLNRFQKVNHFPGSWCIGRKDRLMRTLARHKREVSSAASAAAAVAAAAAAAAAASTTAGVPKGFGGGGGGRAGFRLGNSPGSGAGSLDVTPDGFILPADRRAWLKAVEEEPKAIWIVKPPASSCGRGIRVINRSAVGSVSKSKKCLVQRYIHNPMLIDGRKFDLRLYVLVTSMEPLRVYLFEEGLVRLSTKKYSLKNLRSRFTHLTNYSINKRSGSFKAPDDSDGLEATESTSASKWALTFFWKYLEQSLGKAKSEQVQRSVEDVVLRTMAAADGDMTTHSHQATRHRDCCYELFGFDVLLDEHLKPWLLEVNISPSLFGSSALDRRIKGTLVADIFHLVGFRPFDRTALRREERIEAKHIPGTKRATRAVAGRPQDAWRRFQTPASINLGELGEDEWEVIRDTEDEQHRAGHFRILYPTAENVARLWSTFRSPRFLNGVLARWVLTGGLSNLSNRADIGLIAERLATLGGGGARHTARGKLAGGSTESGGCSTSTSRGKGRGSGPSCGGNADGRWEETTSNATTVVSGGGRGARLELGGLLAGGAPPPWPGAASARPASSATSRASRSSSLARRPLWRETSASASARVAESGPQRAPDERSGNGSQSGRRSGSGAGGGGGSSVRGARGAPLKAGSKVPRLQPRRIDSRVVVGPSLLTVRTNPLSARRIGSGNGGGGGDALEVAPKAWRASSASSSRQSTGRSNTSNKSFGGSVAKLGAPLSSGVRLPVDDRRGSRESLSLLSATKGRDTGRRKPPPPLQQGKQQRQQQRQQEQEQGQQKIHGSRRAGFVGYPVDAATAAVSVVDDTGAAAGHAPAAQADLGSRMTDAAFISPLGHAIVGNGACFPRPPCRAGRHAVESVDGGAVDPLPAFPAATLPTRCSKLTATDGVLTPRSVSGAALRTRVNAESGRGNRVRDSNIGGSSSSGGGGGDGTSGSSGSSSSSSGGNDSIALGLLVDSRALKGVLVEPSALSLRGGGGARGLRENMAAAMAAAMAAQPPKDGLFPISIAKGSGRAAMP